MNKKYKLDMTRPEFLKKILTECDDDADITWESLNRVLPESSNLIYTGYTVLMESDIKRSSVRYVSCDDESIVIKLESKTQAKLVKDNFNREEIRLGSSIYSIRIKVDGVYVVVSLKKERSLFADEDPMEDE